MSATAKFNQEALAIHNELRSLHKAPALSLSQKLTRSAQKWADQLAKKDRLEHSPESNTDFGENVAHSFNSKSDYEMSAEEACLMWYGEVKDYVFGQEQQDISNIGHFSQMVWKASKEVGFGRAKASSGNWYIVAQYLESGNVLKQFRKNVDHPVSDYENNRLVQKLSEQPDVEQISNHQSDDDEHENNFGEQLDFSKLEDFREEVLEAHNNSRRNHGCGRLTRDSALDDMAQKWSANLAKKSRLAYNNQKWKGEDIGENICVKLNNNTELSGKRLVESWYEEGSNYDHSMQPNSKQVDKYGHFTQLIWNNSRKIGIGASIDGSENTYVVVFYSPAGNRHDEFIKNVPKRR